MIGALKRGQPSGFRGRLGVMLVAIAVAAPGLSGQAPTARAQGTGESQAPQTSIGTEACVRPQTACLDPDLTIALEDETVSVGLRQPQVLTVVVQNLPPEQGRAGRPAELAAGGRLFFMSLWAGLRYTAFRAPDGYACTQPSDAVSIIDCTSTAPQQIGPGKRLVFSFAVDFRPSTGVISQRGGSYVATVDPDNRVAEREESNNREEATITLQGPTLVVTQAVSDKPVKNGGEFTTTIRITNIGDGPARVQPGATLLRLQGDLLRLKSITPSRGFDCATEISTVHETVPVNGVPTVFDVPISKTECNNGEGPVIIRPGETLEFTPVYTVQTVPTIQSVPPSGSFLLTVWLNPDNEVDSIWWHCNVGPTSPISPGCTISYAGGYADFG